MATETFTTSVTQAGSRAMIVLPFDPNVAWGEKARHHIRGTINNCAFRGEVVAEGEQYFLSLGAAWRRDNGVEVGDQVTVELHPEGPQSTSVADDIAAAFDAAPEAQAFFDALPTFYRNNYMRWIESAKRAETRAKRIAEMVELLNAGKRER